MSNLNISVILKMCLEMDLKITNSNHYITYFQCPPFLPGVYLAMCKLYAVALYL